MTPPTAAPPGGEALSHDGPLPAERPRALAASGWTDPAVPDGDTSWPNWYRYFTGQNRSEEAAHSMVIALADVLRVQESDLIRLHVFQAALVNPP